MVRSTTPDVVAHRGASAHRAEHTLGAYELALSQGADALECDIRVSRDGHLVCVHDRRIDRTSSGSGVVSSLTVDAMSGLDFSGWHPASGNEAERGVLTLEKLLGLVKDHSRPVRLFVETKHPVRYGGLVEQKLIAMLARHGWSTPEEKETSPVVMMSFSGGALRRVRKAAPKLPTVLLFDRCGRRLRNGILPPWADAPGRPWSCCAAIPSSPVGRRRTGTRPTVGPLTSRRTSGCANAPGCATSPRTNPLRLAPT